MRVSSPFLKVILQLPTSSSLSSCQFYPSLYLSFSNPLQKAVSMQNVTNPVRLPFTYFMQDIPSYHISYISYHIINFNEVLLFPKHGAQFKIQTINTVRKKMMMSANHQNSFSNQMYCSEVIPIRSRYSGDSRYFSWPRHLLPPLFYSLSLEFHHNDTFNIDCVNINGERYR